jgi:hypothetical protein
MAMARSPLQLWLATVLVAATLTSMGSADAAVRPNTTNPATSRSYLVDYAGTFNSSDVSYWHDVYGSKSELSGRSYISMTFNIWDMITPGATWYQGQKVQTRLIVSGTVHGTLYGVKGAAFPCSGKLSALEGAQGDGAVSFNQPAQGDVLASTTLPSATMIASSYTGNVSLCRTGPTSTGADPWSTPNGGPNSPMNKAMFPSLVLPPHATHVEQKFSASIKEFGYTTSVSATMTVQPASPYVALGDSFSSGAINPPYDSQYACWRSKNAYPVVYDPSVIFLACSGASSQQILTNQVPFIPSDTKLVTLTAGGDDNSINLWGTMTECFLYQVVPAAKCEHIASTSLRDGSAFATLKQDLIALLHAIHAQAPNARIFVLGYPIPIPQRDPPGGCRDLTLAQGGVLPLIGDRDLPFLFGLLEKLNSTVAAAAAGASSHYVAPFTGHDVCSSDSAFAPVVSDYRPGVADAPLHPNSSGQHELAALLREAAGAPPS